MSCGLHIDAHVTQPPRRKHFAHISSSSRCAHIGHFRTTATAPFCSLATHMRARHMDLHRPSLQHRPNYNSPTHCFALISSSNLMSYVPPHVLLPSNSTQYDKKPIEYHDEIRSLPSVGDYAAMSAAWERNPQPSLVPLRRHPGCSYSIYLD